MADKEITDLVTATTLNTTDWFHVKQGSTDVKMVIGDILNSHINSANPHSVTKSQVGLSNVLNVTQLDRSLNFSDVLNKATARTNLDVYSKAEIATQISNHSNLVNNPHSVTKAQVGLSNVNNFTITNDPREDTTTKYATGKAVAVLASELDVLKANQTPKGAIMMWSPLAGAIPVGWAVCNGQTVGGLVTPNLIDKFPKFSEVVNAGVTSGNNSVSHTHTGTVAGHALTETELPPHNHEINTRTYGNSSGSGDTTTVGRGSDGSFVVRDTVIKDAGGGQPHSHPLSVNSATIDITPYNYTIVPIIKYV